MTTTDPASLRFKRTYLLGCHSLGELPTLAMEHAFLEERDACGPFEELISTGHVDSALAVYRAHVPFGEIDPEVVPHILSRALPRCVSNKDLTEGRLRRLITFVGMDVLPAVGREGGAKLVGLTESVARMMVKQVVFEYPAGEDRCESDERRIEIVLALAKEIAKCGTRDPQQSVLVRTVEETHELFAKHNVLRSIHSLEDVSEEQYKRDVEAFLKRAQTPAEVDLELNQNVTSWCKRTKTNRDQALLAFIASPDVECDSRWTRVVAAIQSPCIRLEAALLLIKRARPPYSQDVRDFLQQERAASRREDVWIKETRIMDIKEIVAKYQTGDTIRYFDLNRHLPSLQRFLCTRAAAVHVNHDAFEPLVNEALFVSPGYDYASVVALTIKMMCENYALDEVEIESRVDFALSKLLPDVQKRVSQEVILHCWKEMCDSAMDDYEEEEDESITVSSASSRLIGLKVSQFIASSCLSSLTSSDSFFIDVNDYVKRFSKVNAASLPDVSRLSSASVVAVSNNISTMEDYDGTAADVQEKINRVLSCLESDLSLNCDMLIDALVVSDISRTCKKSLNRDMDNAWTPRFVECPNVLDSDALVPVVERCLNATRRSGVANADVMAELLNACNNLEANGANHTALRLKMHCKWLQLFSSKVSGMDVNRGNDTGEDDLLFRLGSFALHRKVINESLALGYLTSLRSRDAASVLFRAESKLINDAFNDCPDGADDDEYGGDTSSFDLHKFERLCMLGKRLGSALNKSDLMKECDRNARFAKWFICLSECNVKFDRTRMIKGDNDYVRIVANEWFATFFNPISHASNEEIGDQPFSRLKLESLTRFLEDFGFQKDAQGELTRILLRFIEARVLKQTNETANDVVSPLFLLQWARACDLAVLVPVLDAATLKYDGSASLFGARTVLDVLMDLVGPETDCFFYRVRAMERNEWNYWKLVQDPITELVGKRDVFTTIHDSPLDRLEVIQRAFNIEKDTFLIGYCTRLLETKTDDNNRVSFSRDFIPLLECVENVESRVRVAREFGADATKPCSERVEAYSFAFENAKSSSSDLLQKIAKELRKARVRNIFEAWKLSSLNDKISDDVFATPMALVKLFFEHADFTKSLVQVREAALVLSETETVLSDSLKRSLLEWLRTERVSSDLRNNVGNEDDLEREEEVHDENQIQLLAPCVSSVIKLREDRIVDIVARGVMHVEGSSENASKWLRKFAFTNHPSIKLPHVARARALKALAKYRPLAEDEVFELRDRERMFEFEVCQKRCASWNQSTEQIFAPAANKRLAVEGLLRDAPEKDARCFSFLVRLISDFDLFDVDSVDKKSSLLERVCTKLLRAGGENEVLDALLRCPAARLFTVRDENVWMTLFSSLADAVAIGSAQLKSHFTLSSTSRATMSKVALLAERCPFDAVILQTSESFVQPLRDLGEFDLATRFEYCVLLRRGG